MVGMYEESAKALEEYIRRSATPWDRLYLHLATAYSLMGRLEEARDLVLKALEFNPKMTAELWRTRKRFQYKDPKHTDRIIDAIARPYQKMKI